MTSTFLQRCHSPMWPASIDVLRVAAGDRDLMPGTLLEREEISGLYRRYAAGGEFARAVLAAPVYAGQTRNVACITRDASVPRELILAPFDDSTETQLASLGITLTT